MESVDAARTVIVHAARRDKLKILMVTSALQGEGKTVLASHLAVSLASAGHRTLLVDCDLRKPSLHRLFQLPLEPGLGELLRGQAQFTAALQRGPVDKLVLLSAGTSARKAANGDTFKRLAELFAKIRDWYDFIIVDSAPVLPVADSLQIGQYVDGVLLSVLRDVSRLPALYAACDRLGLLDIRVLGAVVVGSSFGHTGASSYHADPAPEVSA
jgi:capsular exopolysaccharide synthesis family protein